MQFKYTKIHEQEIPSIVCNILEFFYVPIYIVFQFDLHEKFQAASTYDINKYTKFEVSHVLCF